ncbi:ankyrin repeat-containing protein [Besnoitia besnoiti]|uniref:Ankyrin repeat-containing protein n=1 Tax=Besnoitia besnoiti TaxID=94643 RepID=A0A2A9MCT4_BESBE|nr:ankyrin repeat-containing protein [Besnoitia besnoiti]PFH35805.1 ankyrin repeat-containing protein [Besnoitia besnoiti]
MWKSAQLSSIFISAVACAVVSRLVWRVDWMQYLRRLSAACSRAIAPHCSFESATAAVDVEHELSDPTCHSFEEATVWVSTHGKGLPVEDQLHLYGLYKQAHVGDCADAEPSMVELARHAKWEAWRRCLGMTMDQAREDYTNTVNQHRAAAASKISTIQTNVAAGSAPMGRPQSSLRHVEQRDDSELSQAGLFFRHAANGDITSLVEDLGKDPALVKARNEDDMTALHLAADRGHIEVVDLLLKNGADVNAQDNSGETPLHVAVVAENLAVVSLLLRGNADVLLQTHDGETVLDVANNTHNSELGQMIAASSAA